MKEKILLEDFLHVETKHTGHKLLDFSDKINVHNFFSEGFNLNEVTQMQINKLESKEKEYLVEAVTKDSIDKAVFVFDHSNEELVANIRMCNGDITKIKHFNTIQKMLKDALLIYHDNQELNKADEILKELEYNKQVYTQAFRNNNTVKKVIFHSSALAAIYTIIKEHSQSVDYSESQNDGKIVMLQKAHYIADKFNLKALNLNLKTLRKAHNATHATGHAPVTETRSVVVPQNPFIAESDTETFSKIYDGIKDAGTTVAGGVSAVAAGISTFASGVSAVLGSTIAQTALAVGFTVGFVYLVILSAFIAYYCYKRYAAKPVIDYIKSFEHIYEAAKNSEHKADKTIFKTIDFLKNVKSRLLKTFSNDKSRNIQDLLKELNKDVNTIKHHKELSNQFVKTDSKELNDIW